MIVARYIKYLLERFTFYYFYIDLVLLEFFSRKYPYLLFLFTFFHGSFGYTQFAETSSFKIACLLFSWNLICTSIMVFCVFNLPFTRDYLYNLLGKDFVVKKFGNPGTAHLLKFAGVATAGYGVNELGRIADTYAIPKGAQVGLEGSLKSLEENTFLSDKDKAQLAKEAFHTKNNMLNRTPEGTFDRMAKMESYQKMTGNFSNALGKIFGGKGGKD